MRRNRQPRTRTNRESGQSSSQTQKPSSSRLYFKHGIDLNTNLGEGFGPFKVPNESDMVPFVTSANIACGAHAGDPVIMEAALEEVRYYGLALGAHIGYPDMQGFGRREMHLSTSELRAFILYQLGALAGLARTFGFEFTQVRPHGFLYRQMFHDVRIAGVVAKAVAEYDRWLVLIGPAGNNLLAAGEKAGIRVAQEAWIDRTYDPTGSLLPHSHTRSVIKSPNEILAQANSLIRYGQVTAVDGSRIDVDFDTIHFHAHMTQAKVIAEEVRRLIPNACPLTSEPFVVGREESSDLAFGVY